VQAAGRRRLNAETQLRSNGESHRPYPHGPQERRGPGRRQCCV